MIYLGDLKVMKITLFSFIMAIIWSTLSVFILFIFIKKSKSLRKVSVSRVLVLYFLVIARMLIPIEFFFTKEIVLAKIFNRIYDFLHYDTLRFYSCEYSWLTILILIWSIVAVILILRFLIQYILVIKKINEYYIENDEKYEKILIKVAEKVNKKLKVKVLKSKEIQMPIGIGILNKRILLPDYEYSDIELEYILFHEYTHFVHKDLELKMLIQMYSCIFWWNPVVYFLRKEFNQILEIKCDLCIVKDMNNVEKADYLSSIVKVLKACTYNSKNIIYENKAVFLTGNNNSSLAERFKIIISNKKSSKNNRVLNFYWYICIIMFLISYLFVIQPKYAAPYEEVFTEEGIFEITYDNSYIQEDDEGSYVLVNASGFEQKIEGKQVEIMKNQGFKIEEEK